jgi:NAD(P) transhydrogenase subunit beta
MITQELAAYGYLIAAICFIMALRGLSSPVTSRQGNLYGVIGMVVAIGVTIATPGVVSPWLIVGGLLVGGAIGALVAMRIQMTALPQLVAAFHSLVGLAAVFVAAAAFVSPDAFGIGSPDHIKTQSLIEMGLGTIIGAITFTGSVVAFAKLQGLVTGSPLVFRGQHPINALLGIALVVLLVWFAMRGHPITFLLLIGLSLALGFLLILPIGGADMPVVVSMLNSYSGWAAAGIGFTLGNTALIVTGALVGSSGAILSYIMCKGMNRSIFNVILGGFGTDSSAAGAAHAKTDKPVKAGSAEDAAFLMQNAQSVIIVPGYGMAVAQAT